MLRGGPKDNFIVGRKYEMYIPVAKHLRGDIGLEFADTTNYQVTCHGNAEGMLWTKDIRYHRVSDLPPPPSACHLKGSPIIPTMNRFIREATDE